jgi:Uma2 family endonuclease
MGQAGVLQPEDHVELIEGWLVKKMTKNPRHRATTRRVRLRLESVLPEGCYLESQEPLVTADSEPEPDAYIVRGTPERFEQRHPTAADVSLVVEVADTSLERDRVVRAHIYAQAGIATYWIVNVEDRRIEVYSRPDGDTYAERTDYVPGTTVPVRLDGVVVAELNVTNILG